ncbi:hypothetical protein MASR1M90_23350 [Desulfovibrionales bacterium]
MDADQYRKLLSMSDFAFIAELDGEIAGFLLALREGRPYDNGNYRWFTSHLKNFLYIDRVVVDEAKRGIGLGRSLYAQLFTWSVARQIRQVAAEIDIEPPNPISLTFHDRHGFVELGTRILDNGKRVSMQVKTLESEEAETNTTQAQQDGGG